MYKKDKILGFDLIRIHDIFPLILGRFSGCLYTIAEDYFFQT